jgi:hypothetical protein
VPTANPLGCVCRLTQPLSSTWCSGQPGCDCEFSTAPPGSQNPRAEQVTINTLEARGVAFLPLGGARESAHPCKINHRREKSSSHQVLCTSPQGCTADELPPLAVLQPLPDPRVSRLVYPSPPQQRLCCAQASPIPGSLRLMGRKIHYVTSDRVGNPFASQFCSQNAF